MSKALTVAAYRDKIHGLAREADVTAVIPERWRPAPEPSAVGVPGPEPVPVRFPGSNHLHHYPGASSWLDRHAPDLVHVDEEPYSLVTLQLSRLCRKRRIPFVFFAWQNLDRRLPPPFARIRWAVLRSAHGGLAGTAAAARVLRSAGFKRPIRVIPQFGIDPDRFTPDTSARLRGRLELGIDPDTFVVGYGGRLLREKGVHVLVEAVARLAGSLAEGASTRLLIIGDGPERESLEQFVIRGGLGTRVRFLGHLPSLRMPEVIRACDVVALPSLGTRTWTEQFGRILVESMACGVPVVASRCGEVPEVVGDAGDLVPPGDVDALATALARLLCDVPLRTRRGEAGRARAVAEFSQGRVVTDTLEFYRRILEVRERVA